LERAPHRRSTGCNERPKRGEAVGPSITWAFPGVTWGKIASAQREMSNSCVYLEALLQGASNNENPERKGGGGKKD